jgi:RNA polymerase sigma-70 factor (ECF subfamily)
MAANVTCALVTADPEQTIQSASRGDPAAIEALLERHLPRLRAFVRLRVGPELRNRESASDIVQSACREVLVHMERFRYRGEDQFRRWLFTTALRKLADKVEFHRAAKRDMRRDRAAADWSAVAHSYADVATPSRRLMLEEQAALLESAFDRLSADQREVLTLARIVGLPHAEIAIAMERTEGACRALLHRATAQLGMILANLNDER